MFKWFKKKKPNILLIMLDGVRSNTIDKVPYLNKLKEEASFYSNAVTYAPYTLGALHSIFSGMYGSTNGVNGYFRSYNFDKEHCFTIAQYLKEAGYYTEADVINEDLIPKQGFDKVRVHDEFESKLTERHPEILQQIKDKGPFFLFLDYNLVHTSLVKNIIKKHTDFDKDYFDNKEKNFEQYLGYVQDAGKYMEYMVEKLKELGLYDDTVILIFSDHGCSTGDRFGEKVYGVYLYDYTIRTFIYAIGQNIPKNVELPQQVRLIDLFSTILDVANVSVKGGYKNVHGRSILSIAANSSDDRIAYSETGGLGGPTPSPYIHNVKSVRTNEWKLIYNITTDKKELFDLKQDPNEQHDLSSENKEKTTEMWEKLEKVDSQLELEEGQVHALHITKAKDLDQLHTKLKRHLAAQEKHWKSFVYAQDKGFYQGFEEIKIDGCRPTEVRWGRYQIDKYLGKDKRALDIGNNCGFFTLFASRHLGHIDGVEINPFLVAVANETKRYLGITNATFHNSGFEDLRVEEKYDIVFSFANDSTIDDNTTFHFKEYIGKTRDSLKENGLLIFESQAEDIMENTFEPKFEHLKEHFEVIEDRMVDSNYPYNVPQRRFLILKKK